MSDRRDEILDVAERLIRMQLERTREQRRFLFDVVGIGHAAVDGAHGGTLLFVKVSDTLCAALRVDDVNLFAFADRFVRTLRLARSTIDALFGDHRRHG